MININENVYIFIEIYIFFLIICQIFLDILIYQCHSIKKNIMIEFQIVMPRFELKCFLYYYLKIERQLILFFIINIYINLFKNANYFKSLRNFFEKNHDATISNQSVEQPVEHPVYHFWLFDLVKDIIIILGEKIMQNVIYTVLEKKFT